MSQHATHQSQRETTDDEDITTTPQRRPRAPGRDVRPGQPAGRPLADGGPPPDGPDEGEFTLIGDDDLAPADLGPAAPNTRDPDADSGRVRKITR